jgi:hypothetical protein
MNLIGMDVGLFEVKQECIYSTLMYQHKIVTKIPVEKRATG